MRYLGTFISLIHTKAGGKAEGYVLASSDKRKQTKESSGRKEKEPCRWRRAFEEGGEGGEGKRTTERANPKRDQLTASKGT